MVQPASIKNTDTQSTDTIVGPGNAPRVKLAVGDVDVGLTPHAAWQGVATHVGGATFVAADGVIVGAGLDETDLVTVRPALADAAGRLVVVAHPLRGAVVNKSGTVTVGATAQTLAAANTARKYLFVQNVDDGEDLWINFTTAAVRDQPSIRLRPGESFEMTGGFLTTELVSVIATTTGHKFTAKEG